MEEAIFDLAHLVALSDSPLIALLWMVLIGCLIWLPSLLTPLFQIRYGLILAKLVIGWTMVPILCIAIEPIFNFASHGSFDFLSKPLLHILALGLLAIWIWLLAVEVEASGDFQEGANVADICRDFVRSDLLTLTRLALWLTLSLMPTLKWS